MKALLQRHEQGDQGSFGQLVLGSFSCFTGELPWRDNAPSVSCIPAGAYRAVVTYSPRFGRGLYLVGTVAGRTGIRIHPANLMGQAPRWKSQLNGCIALGEKLGWLAGQKAVLVSVPAVRRLHEYTAGKPFDLEIRNA